MSSTSEDSGVTSWEVRELGSKVKWGAFRGSLPFRASHLERLRAAERNRLPPSISPSPQGTPSWSRVMTHATDFFMSQLVSWELFTFAQPTRWVSDISLYPKARFTQARGRCHGCLVLLPRHPSLPSWSWVQADASRWPVQGHHWQRTQRELCKTEESLLSITDLIKKKEVVKKWMW